MILKGKNVLIMGIRNKWSIAYGAAISAIEQGAKVLYTYHPTEDERKIKELMSTIPDSVGYPCDVAADEDIEKLFTTIKNEHTVIHGVLHSIAHAKTEDLRGEFVNTSRDGFAHASNISAFSLIAVAKYAKEVLSEGGSIVSLTYYGSQKVIPGYNIMGVAKAALECSTMYLAGELGASNIRVNCVSAGAIKTLSAKGIKDFNEMLDLAEQKAPLRKKVDIKQVGDAVAFLFSDMSSAITGQVIYVDNGCSIVGA